MGNGLDSLQRTWQEEFAGDRRRYATQLLRLPAIAERFGVGDVLGLLHLLQAVDGTLDLAWCGTTGAPYCGHTASLQGLLDRAYERLEAGDVGMPAVGIREGVAVISLHDYLANRRSLEMLFFGGTHAGSFLSAINWAVNNADVKSILLDVQSPGGPFMGAPELAASIRRARQEKPTYAVATGAALGAAYLVAAQTTHLFASPSALLGDVGIAIIHREASVLNDRAGVTYTLIRAGENKALANDVEPLTARAHAQLQEKLDRQMDLLLEEIAAGRGTEPKSVRERSAGGKLFLAAEAVTSGLADEVARLDEVLSRLVAA